MMGSTLSIFTVKTNEYSSITVNEHSLTVMIYAICMGVVISAVYMWYQKNVVGEVARRIIAKGASTEESAVSASELSLSKIQLRELTKNQTLARLICTVSEESGETRYFLPEENRIRAEVRYEKEGNGVGGLLLTVALTAVLALLLIWLMPVVLRMADHILK